MSDKTPNSDLPDEAEGAHLAFSRDMSYGDYLQLDRLLSAQVPVSGHHDEMLFIVQHQTTELWLKLAIHELVAARDSLLADNLAPAEKMMARVARILTQINQAWDVLATLTPSEYLEFRPSLGKSSGFQSHQYRALEFILGNKSAAMMEPHRHRNQIFKWLTQILESPSLYDAALGVLARRGLPVDSDHLNRDLSRKYDANASVEAAWATVYGNRDDYWDLYQLAEKLVDFEHAFRLWRFSHMTTVSRIIGYRRGTGGTSGVNYLEAMLKVRLFPELWDVRTSL
ncbi:MAG: tryptophan 2,3-dioxygenase [Rhizobiaceae bacterium]